ncbi:hypothetical protein DITRI_Ditri09bG0007400 [Diplodiscus trichospermus]
MLYSLCYSLKKILDRYAVHVNEEAAVCNHVNEARQQIHEKSKDIRQSTSLREMVQRDIEGQNIEHLNMTELMQLEKRLDSILRQTRNQKAQVMVDTVAALREKEKQLRREKQVMEKKIAEIMEVEDGERLNQQDFHSSNCEPPQKGLLHLF